MENVSQYIDAMGGPSAVARKMAEAGYPGIGRQRVRGWHALNTITPGCIPGFVKAARKENIKVTVTTFTQMLSDRFFEKIAEDPNH